MIFASFHQGKEEIKFAFAFSLSSSFAAGSRSYYGGVNPVGEAYPAPLPQCPSISAATHTAPQLKSIDNNLKIIYNEDSKDLSPLIYIRR
jgi:hypothetical protein